MGDWQLTDFNSQLAERAYAHSFDYPSVVKKAGPGLVRAELPPQPPACPLPWYCGPRWLSPENIGYLERYFREAPGAWRHRLGLPFAGWAGTVGCACLLITVGLLARPLPSTPAATMTEQPNRIRMLNPAWVRQNSSYRHDEQDEYGYFSLPANVSLDQESEKFILVEPTEAQHYLEELIQLGLLMAGNRPVDAAKNFAELKKLGIITD